MIVVSFNAGIFGSWEWNSYRQRELKKKRRERESKREFINEYFTSVALVDCRVAAVQNGNYVGQALTRVLQHICVDQLTIKRCSKSMQPFPDRNHVILDYQQPQNLGHGRRIPKPQQHGQTPLHAVSVLEGIRSPGYNSQGRFL